MLASSIILALPTADRARTHAYYGAGGLGLETPGDEIADDGVPEPLRVVLNEGLTVMFIPPGGFGWTVAGRAVAEPGTVECQLVVELTDRADVDAFVERARAAGAEVAAGPEEKQWGYVANLADPDGHLMMVIVPVW